MLRSISFLLLCNQISIPISFRFFLMVVSPINELNSSSYFAHAIISSSPLIWLLNSLVTADSLVPYPSILCLTEIWAITVVSSWNGVSYKYIISSPWLFFWFPELFTWLSSEHAIEILWICSFHPIFSNNFSAIFSPISPDFFEISPAILFSFFNINDCFITKISLLNFKWHNFCIRIWNHNFYAI